VTSADALAELLDLDAHDTPICLACLSDVVFTLDNRDVGKINGSITTMAPHLWAEGLEQPVRLASRRALENGIGRRGPRARRRRCERAA